MQRRYIRCPLPLPLTNFPLFTVVFPFLCDCISLHLDASSLWNITRTIIVTDRPTRALGATAALCLMGNIIRPMNAWLSVLRTLNI